MKTEVRHMFLANEPGQLENMANPLDIEIIVGN